MPVEMKLDYRGQLRCELEHGPSNERIRTDAPLDNEGRGEAFSPTDLVGAALVSCAVTTMAIKGPKVGVPVASGVKGRVAKTMSTEGPRRIALLEVEFEMPPGLDAESRKKLEDIAQSCPVALSLGEGVQRPMKFIYPD
jgi:putative redox protein